MQTRSKHGDYRVVHKQASTYITEIAGQRKRLRNDMSDAVFYTWHAETLTILEYIPEIEPLKQRFIDVGRSNDRVVDKIQDVRVILSSVVKRIHSPLFGTVMVSGSPLPNIGGIVFAPTMMQTLTQSINVNLDTLLQRVDEVQGISDENKEEARSVVRNIWDHITSGARDSVKFLDLTTRLTMLGFKVGEILSGLQF